MKTEIIIIGMLVCILMLSSCSNNNASTGNLDNQNNNPNPSPATQNNNPGYNGPRQGFNRTFQIDYNAAAATLGISVDDLHNALDDANGSRPNFQNAAEKLNITMEDLRTALGFPANMTRGNFTRRRNMSNQVSG